MRDLMKGTVISITIAMIIFCFVGMIFDIRNGGHFGLENYQFTKMVVGCVLVGLGFGVPSVVYRNDNFPMPIKVVIHLGIGSIVYTIVAFRVGWAEGATMVQSVMIVAIQLVVAFVIWLAFMIYYRSEAKKINKRIQSGKN